jgi:cytochrome c5
MNTGKQRLLVGGALTALALTALMGGGGGPPAARAAEGDEVKYTFGRPVRDGERTYDWYRKTHADWAAKRYGVDPKAVGDGMDTWHWWCGVDNPGFWREMAKLTSKKENVLTARIDLLRMLHTVPRAERWEKIGLINDPDCVAAEKPDQYGLKIDRMKDGALTWDPDVFGFSSGVVGLQLFRNKNFDAKKWSIDKYLDDASNVEPPYLVGMACTVCHTAFNPNRPPKNPAEPKWENLDSHIGSQYFREGMLFGYDMPKDSFAWHYLYHQQPGTSETTRFPTDFINGPVLINSIYRLNDRLKLARAERVTAGQKAMLQSINRHVGLPENDGIGGTDAEPTYRSPRVLSTGGDSMGLVIAAARVYVNEGSGYQDWFPTWALNPYDLKGSQERGFKQSEFDILGKVRKDPQSPWMQTEARMPNMALYLSTHDGFPLKDAIEAEGKGSKNGKDYLTTDADVLRKGKVAFADHCARCHSSKKPDNLPEDAEARKKAWRDLVLRDDFLTDNYLSDDERYPCSELGTNIARALSPNWDAGGGYGQMSSLGFKQNQAGTEQVFDHDRAGKPIPLYNPLTGKHDIKFTAKNLFYRTPTLVSIWATAPYLHNNSVGLYNGDPSVAGRMAAYEDGMTKLLWPERRLGVGSMLVTTQDSKLPDFFPMLMKMMPEFSDLPGLDLGLINVPKGTPVNLLMNLHARDVKAVLQAYVDGILQGHPRSEFAELRTKNHAQGQKRLMEKLVEVSTCPDFIEDRGHTYGRELSDDDKRALIEYMKHF